MKGKGCNEPGFALIAALFILLVLGILGAILVGIQSTSLRASVKDLNSAKALAIADAGIRWAFEMNLANDLNFSDNMTSPTGVPYSPPAFQIGEGYCWINYLNQTAASIDVEAIARVNELRSWPMPALGEKDAERRVRCNITIRSAKPLRRVIYAVGNVDLTNAGGSISSPVSPPYAAIESQSTVSLAPPASLSVTSTSANSQYRRWTGIDLTYFSNHADTVVAGNLTFTPGVYGNVNGYIWYVPPGGDVILNDGGVGGTITIDGTVVAAGGQIKTQGSPTVIWTGRSKGDLDGDGIVERLPAFVADSADLRGSSILTVNGLVCTRTGDFGLRGSCNFTLNGVLLSGSTVTTSGTVTVHMTYDPVWDNSPYPGALDVPWLLIQGPDVEYEFTQWRETVVQ